MKTLKQLFFLFLFLNLFQLIKGQDKVPVRFGKVLPTDFDVKPPATDSAANAIVVADWGTTEFVADANRGGLNIEFTRKRRVKIMNKNGFDAANVRIDLYTSGRSSSEEKLISLKAYTYNLEGSKVTETKVESSSVYTTNENKNWIVKKFTFPALKEGSIIEYSYTINSPFYFQFQSWAFQGQYPVLWSEYNAEIPEYFKYVTLSQGYQPFYINKRDQSVFQFYFARGQHVDGSQDRFRWVMKDVPALKEEAFTTTLNNHIAKLEFQLASVMFPNGLPETYMNDWKKVADELKSDEKFGMLINRSNNWLEDELKKITANAKAPDEKAILIFNYLKNNFALKEGYDINCSSNLKDVFQDKSGTVADINLLLTAMLRHEKIEAYPVILGRRSRGITNEIYPLIDRYNYVIVKVVFADGSIYYLDASKPHLPFGKLPLECYNGHARVVDREMLLPVYFYADSIKETEVINNTISNGEKPGEVFGTTRNNMGLYKSLEIRNKLTGVSENKYSQLLQPAAREGSEYLNFVVDSLKNDEEPIVVSYDTKYKGFADNNIVYFNPLTEYFVTKNPFTSATRFYPVEMPYTRDEIYILNMEIPKGFVVDELPKSTRMMLNENDGMFEYIIQKNATNIQMRARLKINKANFTNADYDSLREFYAYILKKQEEQIVFKKVN